MSSITREDELKQHDYVYGCAQYSPAKALRQRYNIDDALGGNLTLISLRTSLAKFFVSFKRR